MMQFDPRRYPADFDFIVKPTMGIVAREVEAMQMTQLMAMLPEDFPQIRVAVAKGIVELSSLHNKAEIVQAFQEAMQPPSPEEQQKQKELADIQFEAAKAEATQSLLENQHLIAQIRKTLAEAAAMANKGQLDKIKTIQEQDRINIQAEEIDQFENQNEIAQKRLQLQEKQLNWKMRQGPSKNG
jgi:hypothetical protein